MPYTSGVAGYWWAQKKNPYDHDRITAIYDDQDFTWIENAGFDHIRLPIDPDALGFAPPNYTIVPGKVVTYNGTTVAQNIAAIKTIINRAIAHDLAIILDFHPYFVSQKHYDYMVGWNEGHHAVTDTGWKLAKQYPNTDPNFPNNFANLEPAYATYKQPLVTVNDPSEINANHPLCKFWSQFLDQFTNTEAPPDKVYFEIMNEPLVDFNREKADVPSSVSSLALFRNWMEDKADDWRAIQREALKVCLSKKTQHRFIATSAFADAREYTTDSEGWMQQNSNWPRKAPGFGSYYKVGAPDYIGNSAWRLIYTAHVYTPFKNTHYSMNGDYGDSSGGFYKLLRDYQGIGSPNQAFDPNFPHKGWDPMLPALNGVQAWQSSGSTWMTIDGDEYFEWVPPVMFTEAGVYRRDVPLGTEPGFCDPLVTPFPHVWDITYPATPDNSNTSGITQNDRWLWHYDFRKKCDEYGFGWSVYEWQGALGISEGCTLSAPVSGNPNKSIHLRGIHGPINDFFSGALFSWSSRPRGY